MGPLVVGPETRWDTGYRRWSRWFFHSPRVVSVVTSAEWFVCFRFPVLGSPHTESGNARRTVPRRVPEVRGLPGSSSGSFPTLVCRYSSSSSSSTLGQTDDTPLTVLDSGEGERHVLFWKSVRLTLLYSLLGSNSVRLLIWYKKFLQLQYFFFCLFFLTVRQRLIPSDFSTPLVMLCIRIWFRN